MGNGCGGTPGAFPYIFYHNNKKIMSNKTEEKEGRQHFENVEALNSDFHKMVDAAVDPLGQFVSQNNGDDVHRAIVVLAAEVFRPKDGEDSDLKIQIHAAGSPREMLKAIDALEASEQIQAYRAAEAAKKGLHELLSDLKGKFGKAFPVTED